MAAPIYQPQVAPTLGSASGVSAPVNIAGAAATGFGKAAITALAQWEYAQDTTTQLERTTEYLRGVNDLETKYSRDPDFRTASDRFKAEVSQLRQNAMRGGLSPMVRARLGLTFERLDIGAESTVRTNALRREASANVANLATLQHGLQGRLQQAKTPAEREAIHKEYADAAANAVNAGWITAAGAQSSIAGFRRSSEYAAGMDGIASNPRAAVSALSDPKQFTWLDPVQRQTLLRQARAANDRRTGLSIVNAARANPIKGTALYGRVTDYSMMPSIARALVGQESGGNTNAQSPKGAAGIGQFMPDTARVIARKIGWANLEGKSDADVRAELKANPAMSWRMTVQHLTDLTKRYNGRLAPAFAAYHAGEGRGDRYDKLAIEKFGENYTAEQFASLLPDSLHDGSPGKPGKRTSDYVRDMFRRLGADTNTSMTPEGYIAAGRALQAELRSQRNERLRTVARIASLARDQSDITDTLKDGYAIDPQALAAYKQTQTNAALAGDASAAKELRRVEHAERIAPVVREAYQMDSRRLAAAIAKEESRLRGSSNVTPFERERLDALEAVAKKVREEAGARPVTLASRGGDYTMVDLPHDKGTGSKEFAEALYLRGQHAEIAARKYGVLKPLEPEDVAVLQKQWQDAGGNAEARLAIAQTMRDNLSETTYRAAMGQIASGDRTAVTASMFASDAPDVARKIMIGQTYLNQPGVKPKIETLRPALAAAFGGAIYPAEVQKDLMDAALAVYAADRGANGALYDTADQSALRRAVAQVAGQVVKINGHRTVLPRNMPSNVFAKTVRTLSAKDLEPFGGAYDANGAALDPVFLARNAILRPQGVANGRYAVALPGVGRDAPVLTKDKVPLVIDLRKIAEARGIEPNRAFITPMSIRGLIGRNLRRATETPGDNPEDAFQ